MYSRTEVQEAWLTLLERYTWQWFATLTFRDRHGQGNFIHPEAADKLFRVWVSKLNRHIYGPRWYRRQDQGVYWVRALEYTKRGVIHFHALLADINDLNHTARRLQWMDEWYNLAGIARIEKPGDAELVARYVSKYVLKDGEIETSPNLRSYARIEDMTQRPHSGRTSRP